MLRIRQQTDKASVVAQETYTKHLNKKMKTYPISRTGDWPGLDEHLIWIKNTTELATEDSSRKHDSQKKCLHRGTVMHKHSFLIDLKGFHNTISNDRTSLASEAQQSSETTIEVETPAVVDDQLSVDDERNPRKYVVDKLVAHQKENGHKINKVLWYEYSQKKTLEKQKATFVITLSLDITSIKDAHQRKRYDDDAVQKTMTPLERWNATRHNWAKNDDSDSGTEKTPSQGQNISMRYNRE